MKPEVHEALKLTDPFLGGCFLFAPAVSHSLSAAGTDSDLPFPLLSAPLSKLRLCCSARARASSSS